MQLKEEQLAVTRAGLEHGLEEEDGNVDMFDLYGTLFYEKNRLDCAHYGTRCIGKYIQYLQ